MLHKHCLNIHTLFHLCFQVVRRFGLLRPPSFSSSRGYCGQNLFLAENSEILILTIYLELEVISLFGGKKESIGLAKGLKLA